MNRYIALIDCDSFFVSCEQAVAPELKNTPVCVISNANGCVVSRSKEAKALGIKMGMPYFMAKDYPPATYIVANHTLYHEISSKVMETIKQFSPDVEVYSVDEAFIDLTGTTKLFKMNYIKLIKHIRNTILDATDIPVSIGLSRSKTLAKLASDKAKNTGGIYVIGSGKIKKELKHTNINEIWGVGKNLTKQFNRWGVINAFDLTQKQDNWIKENFGKVGLDLKHELEGRYTSKVDTRIIPPKSIQKTSVIGEFTNDLSKIKNHLNYHIQNACTKLRKYDGKANCIGVMLRTKDFQVYYTKKILEHPTNFELEVSTIAMELLSQIYNPDFLYRSCGVYLEKLT